MARQHHQPSIRHQAATRIAAGAAVLGVAVAGLTGCGPGTGGGADPDPQASSGEVGGTVTVVAAATLTDSFTEIGQDFERAHPGTDVVLNFAGSSTLAQQINEGAPADVFASAHPDPMRTVADAEVNPVTPVTFARADLVIAVAAGNPLAITGLADLADPSVTVAICAEQVPCGRAAAAALAAAEVDLVPATYDRDVRAALAKVEIGEVDAALVYRADAGHAAGQVATVEFPESAAAVNDLQISELAEAPNPVAAAAFVDYVLEPGRAVLTRDGYLEP